MNYGLELALFTALHFVKLNILYQTSNTLWFIFVFFRDEIKFASELVSSRTQRM